LQTWLDRATFLYPQGAFDICQFVNVDIESSSVIASVVMSATATGRCLSSISNLARAAGNVYTRVHRIPAWRRLFTLGEIRWRRRCRNRRSSVTEISALRQVNQPIGVPARSACPEERRAGGNRLSSVRLTMYTDGLRHVRWKPTFNYVAAARSVTGAVL